MCEGVAKNGFPSKEELQASEGYHEESYWGDKPLAIVECVQEIPCNPCEEACPTGAIEVGEPITNTPSLNPDKCVGCFECISACPGLAIFGIDGTHSEHEATVSFPFEYLPLPEEGDKVVCVNRKGEELTEGKVLRVQQKDNDHTAVVTVEVPKEYATEVRNIDYRRNYE